MTKKVFFLSIALSGLLLIGCEKESDTATPTDTNVDIAKILAYPYSALTPDQQKVKLENESISLLDNLNAAKTSSAIEAFQNFEKLLAENSVEIIKGKDVTNVKRTVEYAEAYGVFTWDKAKKEWTKTASTTELKFVFPAKESATTNNAVLSVKAVSSGIAMTSEEEEWDNAKQEYITYETTYYLPKSSTATLTINSAEAAKIELTAEYKDNKEAPVSSLFKITTNDGYVFSTNVDKATESKATMKLTHNNKVLIEAVAKSNAKIDELVELSKNDGSIGEGNYNLLGKANAYMKLTDNLILVYTVDYENYEKECDIIQKNYDAKTNALYNGPMNKDYYTLRGQYEKEYYDKLAAASAKYMTVVLVSTKDGSKIADLIEKSEVDYVYYDGYVWNNATQEWDWTNVATKKYDYYTTNSYLKFKDNTLVEASAYFSEGFDKLETKWDDFIKAFDR